MDTVEKKILHPTKIDTDNGIFRITGEILEKNTSDRDIHLDMTFNGVYRERTFSEKLQILKKSCF